MKPPDQVKVGTLPILSGQSSHNTITPDQPAVVE